MTSVLDRLADALGDRYQFEGELGVGGMATVCLAADRKHHRRVAIKVLKPEVASQLGAERFLREIETAATLTHPHILPLFDSGRVPTPTDAEDLLYYVMPYVEGESLRDRLDRDRAMPVDEAIRVATEVAGALDYSHRHGVIHRDIKPENILLHDGQALVADFGIALELTATEAERLTGTGISIGTPHYMSPEQATGDRAVDARSDVYALGCVLYEMLSGRTPIEGDTLGRLLVAKTLGHTTPLRRVRPGLPRELTRAVETAIAAAPDDRFASASAFGDALERAAGAWSDLPNRRRRRRLAVAAGVLLAVAIGAGGTVYADLSRTARARTGGMAELDRLARADQWDSVFTLGRELMSIIPDDSVFLDRWHGMTRETAIRTDPPGASVYRRPYDDAESTSVFLGTTPLEGLRLPIGASRLRIELPGYQTAELVATQYPSVQIGRTELAGHVITLDPVGTIPDDMVRVAGHTVPAALFGLETDLRIGDFWLDRFEVSNRQYQAFVDAGGYQTPEHWTEPFLDGDDRIAWAEAMRRFVDRTGQPGPATWYAGRPPDGQEDYPVAGVSWFEAVAYASFAGKRLPTGFDWGQGLSPGIHHLVVPRSNVANRTDGPAPVGSHRGMGSFGTYDQMGNVREWTYNATPNGRLLLGGGWADPEWQRRTEADPWERSPGTGFRLARYLEDTPALEQTREFTFGLGPGLRDYATERPAGDAEFAVFRRLYDYDSVDLEIRVERADTTADWVRERVTFTTAYDADRMAAYVYLPRAARPPYQTVVFWPGDNVMGMRQIDQFPEAYFDHFVTAGRAVVLPLFKGSFGRPDADRGNSPLARRDDAIEWVQDVRRTVDAIVARPDLDGDRIALVGHSWGGIFWPIAMAVDPRLAVAIAWVAGLLGNTLPEVDPFNFLPRVHAPVLMLGGRYDPTFPYETSQRPMFEWLGTDPDRKSFYLHVGSATVPAGHNVPFADVARESLAWLNTYLGPVDRRAPD